MAPRISGTDTAARSVQEAVTQPREGTLVETDVQTTGKDVIGTAGAQVRINDLFLRASSQVQQTFGESAATQLNNATLSGGYGLIPTRDGKQPLFQTEVGTKFTYDVTNGAELGIYSRTQLGPVQAWMMPSFGSQGFAFTIGGKVEDLNWQEIMPTERSGRISAFVLPSSLTVEHTNRPGDRDALSGSASWTWFRPSVFQIGPTAGAVTESGVSQEGVQGTRNVFTAGMNVAAVDLGPVSIGTQVGYRSTQMSGQGRDGGVYANVALQVKIGK